MLNSIQHTPARNTDIDEQFLNVFDATPVPMVLSRPDGSFEYVNPALLNMLGYEKHDIYDADTIISHPENKALNQEIRARLKADPFSPVVVEKRYLHSSGHIIPGLLTIVAQPDHQGEVCRFISQIQDLTEQKKTQEEMQLAALVYKNSSEAMLVTDADNRILDINPAFSHITGFTLPEVIGKSPSILSSGRHNRSFYRSMWQALHNTGSWRGEIWNKRKNGDAFAERLTIDTIYNKNGSVHRRVALFADISQEKEAEAQILHQTNFDPLTGLPNRRLFLESLKLELNKATRTQQPGALLMLDIDRFKEVNDTLGHALGDELIKQTAKRLTETVRNSDFVARLSGDEFAIILNPISDPKRIDQISQSILNAIHQPFQLGTDTIYASISIGIALFPTDSSKEGQLLRYADQAMYAAKERGRNCYHYYTPAMQEAAQVRMALVNELRYAIERNQFELHYQPIVDLKTGQITKAEALIRWHHPELGLIGPDKFIGVAEDTGLILRIGEWVFNTAANQLNKWRSNGYPQLELSFNTSPLQLLSDGIQPLDWVMQLQRLNLQDSSLIIEITEGLLIQSNQQIRDKLSQLHNCNFQIAIDDFGTGYSNLAYLKDFDVDYLKIDQSFVQNLVTHSNDLALCEAMVAMAHRLGIKVVAEGIESDAQRKLLLSAGCDYGQGWYFSKALPAKAFSALLLEY